MTGAHGRPLLGAPAVQALLIQLLSLLLVLAIARGPAAWAGIQMTVGAAALLQGVLAAGMSRWRALAIWWWPIQLFFPIALLALRALHLPSWLFLAAFFFLLALFWTSFRTQVPFYPSRRAVWRAVAAQLPQGRPVRFIDLGSGFGGLALHLAARRPESVFSGVELAPLPWLVSAVRAHLARSPVRFLRGDYERLGLGDYDVVFAYLSPAAMPALWRKARAEMRAGALLLSYEFPIPGATPDDVSHPVEGGPALYAWRF